MFNSVKQFVKSALALFSNEESNTPAQTQVVDLRKKNVVVVSRSIIHSMNSVQGVPGDHWVIIENRKYIFRKYVSAALFESSLIKKGTLKDNTALLIVEEELSFNDVSILAKYFAAMEKRKYKLFIGVFGVFIKHPPNKPSLIVDMFEGAA